MTKKEKHIVLTRLTTIYELTLHPMERKRALPIYHSIARLAIDLGITENEINALVAGIRKQKGA